MLSHKVLTRQDVGRAASYYEDGADDYYAGEGEASAWQGKGAEALGLEGSVDGGRFRELLAGRVTADGPTSRSATRRDSQSRIGIDLTFSAPKSVSLQALVGGDERIMDAHDRAVARAIDATEERAQTRKKANGESRVEDTRNLVVAKFRHETSREQDPQLHTHALVLNLTRRSDGAWRALRNDEIVKATKYLGAVYRAELAAELQDLGYALRHGREGTFELTHMERAQLIAFSRRTEQIERRMAQEGLSPENATPEQKQRVKLATRPRKVSVDRQALFAEWHARARELRIDLTRPAPHDSGHRRGTASGRRDPGAAAHPAAEGARRSVRFAIAHLTERQAIIEERELLDVALKHAVGRATLPDVRREMARLSSTGYLIPESPLYRAADAPINAPGLPKGALVATEVRRGMARDEARTHIDAAIAGGRLVPVERRFTTQTALEREKCILRIERDGRWAAQPIGGSDQIRSRLASIDLNDGQRAAVELITTSPHRVVGIQGYAGTGKSHMLDHAKGLAEERGHRVVALAPYAAHVRALRELGVEAKTLASFLAAQDKAVDDKTVLVIDEAGTVPTRQMELALKLAEQADARVVLLGDTGQTKAIEAGRPFHQLQAAGMQTVVMAEIERQKDPALREAVSLAARGESESSLARLSDVREVRDDHERRRAIAADFARLPEEERASTIIVAGTNEARREINRAIREDLGLAGRGHEFETLTRRDTTQAERAFSKNYSPGDVIQSERDYPKAGLARGALYEVVENGPGNRLTVRGEKGDVVEFSPMTCRRLSVYEPERSELAAGDRVRVTRNDAARDLANGDRFVVADVTRETVTLTDGKRMVELRADRPLHLDHAYATTVHASQGTTAERVLIDAATKSRTTSQDVYYVAISRARQEARIYTDDLARLPAAVAREHTKHAALDLDRSERDK
ncbi:MobF family relaxase [Anaeromyxobacter sp. PSR-1]|uniref:MobF family relaxase n=1 Tax=Anaeromyxobacter sp. PSR-1 TaxID=1300915 RepID=UPI0005E2DFFC|nr:MobF family relaxase [Anaeromyxobacter sp. PSR-1]GAO01310.1 multifunctional conjugation protein TraI [Anaeromyxobacter sp. PSR-1]